MFNVTHLTSEDNHKSINKKSDNYLPFVLPYNLSDYFSDKGPDIPEMIKHEIEMVDMLVKEDSNKHKDLLHQTKFDAGFCTMTPSEKIISKMHDIPLLTWVLHSDPVISLF